MDFLPRRRFSIKHLAHCVLFLGFIYALQKAVTSEKNADPDETIEPSTPHPFLVPIFYILKSVSFLSVPLMLSHFLGLTLWETFPGKVVRRGAPLVAPFICFRVVTRGDFPELVKNNVRKNLEMITGGGLTNYMMEVVTDKALDLPKLSRFREIVVPNDYATRTGARFKSRALQYCLESDVNILNDDDWIVHMDEETLLTENSVSGILNFTSDNERDIGQGLILYASNEIVNWVTTLADSFRVAADLGAIRFSFNVFQKALFIFKGSYVVTRFSVESDVSFDNGAAGSITEDTYFAMKAWSKGYRFGWIEGEMLEKSPFDLWDFLQQRKRWLQGIFLVVHDGALPLYTRLCLGICLYSWITLPVSVINLLVEFFFVPVHFGSFADLILSVSASIGVYMYFFGAVRSFQSSRRGVLRNALCVLGALMTLPLNIMVETAAVIAGLWQKKNKFYIVKKQFAPVTHEIV